MPIDNLAKVFGPTVIGYSCADPDHLAIFSETAVQKDVRISFERLNRNETEQFIFPRYL